MSSSITIYQSLNDLNDKHLEELVTECQTIMSRGREATIDMCINMAHQQEYIQKNYKRKDRAQVQAMIINSIGVVEKTYFKYARAGRYYLANPDKKHLSMDAVLKKPKQITATTQKPPNIDYKTEYEKLRIRQEQLERRVRELENQVDYMTEEIHDVRDWLDTNTKSKSTGVYNALGRLLN